MIGIGTPRSQSRIPRPIFFSFFSRWFRVWANENNFIFFYLLIASLVFYPFASTIFFFFFFFFCILFRRF